jgi:hypothetical protein
MAIKLYPDLPRQRNSRILRDLLVLLMLVVLAVLGSRVYERVDSIKVVATGVTTAGDSVQGGFSAVAEAVNGVPVIGGRFADALTASGDSTGGNVATLGKKGEDAIHRTALLTGWLTFLVPAALLLAFTVPGRIRLIRQLTRAQRFLVNDGSAERERLMAMRAAFGVPVDVLLEYSVDPIGDLMTGNHGPLLDALYADAGLLRPVSAIGAS